MSNRHDDKQGKWVLIILTAFAFVAIVTLG